MREKPDKALALAAGALIAIAAGCGGGHGSTGTGGAGGIGIGGNAGALGGSGGGDPPSCTGVDLHDDGVLDLDLRAVSVTGTVTRNGAALPDQTGSRGQVVFHGTGSLAEASIAVDLGSTGPKTYGLRLPPGTYDIDYVPGASACAAGSDSVMPCAGGFIRRGAAIAADGVLDLDVRVVVVTGAVTLKGSPYPDQPRAGSLGFAPSVGMTATIPFGGTGPVTYRVNLISGTYDVLFNGDAGGCAQDTPPAIPCNSGVIRTQVNLAADGVLDVDVPAVKVTGAVTLAGAAMPTETANRGALTFAAAAGAAVSTRAFGATGAVSYALTLLPGRYAISLAANAALCGPTLTPQVPCLGGTLMPSVMLAADGVLDVDMRAVTATGKVTLKGQPLPDATADRGSLRFTRAAGGGGVAAGLGMTGPVTYSVRLLDGTYDVDYVANAAPCAAAGAGTPPALPCSGGSIARGVALTADGVLDADLKRVQVNGGVTLKGAVMPDAGAGRGALSFSLAGGGTATTAPFTSTGPVTYALSLWPGTYDVQLGANMALCAAGSPVPAIPCVGGTARTGVHLDADGVLDVDIPAVRVSGNLTLNGAALPAETMNRGSIAVGRLASQGGGGLSFALGTDSAPSYAATVMAGSYLFRHVANGALCGGGSPLPALPCASQIVMGCPR